MKSAISAVLILASFSVTAQGIRFMTARTDFINPNSSLLLLNPSFAGSSGGTRIQSTAMTRNPLESFRSLQMQTSADHYLSNAKAGIGISASTNSMRVLNQSDIAFTWAQHFVLSKDRVKLIPALTLGYRRITSDFLVQTAPGTVASRLIDHRAILGSSVLLEIHERFYMGVIFSDFLLSKTQIPIESRLRSTTKAVHASYNLQLSKNDLLQAVVRFNNQSNFQNLLFGATYLHNSILFGAGIAMSDAGYFQIGYKSKLLTASLQIEAVLSKLAGNRSPSFGINLAATIRNAAINPVWKSVETW